MPSDSRALTHNNGCSFCVLSQTGAAALPLTELQESSHIPTCCNHPEAPIVWLYHQTARCFTPGRYQRRPSSCRGKDSRTPCRQRKRASIRNVSLPVLIQLERGADDVVDCCAPVSPVLDIEVQRDLFKPDRRAQVFAVAPTHDIQVGYRRIHTPLLVTQVDEVASSSCAAHQKRIG